MRLWPNLSFCICTGESTTDTGHNRQHVYRHGVWNSGLCLAFNKEHQWETVWVRRAHNDRITFGTSTRRAAPAVTNRHDVEYKFRCRKSQCFLVIWLPSPQWTLSDLWLITDRVYSYHFGDKKKQTLALQVFFFLSFGQFSVFKRLVSLTWISKVELCLVTVVEKSPSGIGTSPCPSPSGY